MLEMHNHILIFKQSIVVTSDTFENVSSFDLNQKKNPGGNLAKKKITLLGHPVRCLHNLKRNSPRGFSIWRKCLKYNEPNIIFIKFNGKNCRKKWKMLLTWKTEFLKHPLKQFSKTIFSLSNHLETIVKDGLHFSKIFNAPLIENRAIRLKDWRIHNQRLNIIHKCQKG